MKLAVYDLYVHHKLYTLAERAQGSEWIIDVIQCRDGVPLLWIRKRSGECGCVVYKRGRKR